MAEVEHERCTKCHCWRLPASYLNAKGRKLKTCTQCRDRATQYRARSKCEHGRKKYTCRQCDGSAFCEHGKQKHTCRQCDGSAFCEHDVCRASCKTCKPMGHLRGIARSRIHHTLKGTGTAPSVDMLGCTMEEFKDHITAQLHDGMTWTNYGPASTTQRHWNIDHITPLKYGAPTLEEVVARLHYTNTQPMWAADNIAKGNKYVGRPGDEQ